MGYFALAIFVDFRLAIETPSGGRFGTRLLLLILLFDEVVWLYNSKLLPDRLEGKMTLRSL